VVFSTLPQLVSSFTLVSLFNGCKLINADEQVSSNCSHMRSCSILEL
jgi:hypothetical protein